MGINRDKPDLWKKDICKSVDFYNSWFMEFAPRAFRETRVATASRVEDALLQTNYLQNISVAVLREHPEVLPMLRMSTCPPIAQDRLIGLAGVRKNLVKNMEDEENPRVPPRMKETDLIKQLNKIAHTILQMADPDIFTWLSDHRQPNDIEIQRAATIVADRLCGAVANPIIRNAQEKRQLAAMTTYLEAKGYRLADPGTKYDQMQPGTFSFHTNIPARLSADMDDTADDVVNDAADDTVDDATDDTVDDAVDDATDDAVDDTVNITVDVAILPMNVSAGSMPILIEAKSAGDFTNVNKRRKEEAVKMQQLRNTYGASVSYTLLLCGYFDSGYLGYEAAEGIDWVWEHRITDLDQLGI